MIAAAGPIRSISAVVDGTVYAGSNDNHLYALDADTGEELWRYDTGDWVQSSPAVGGGMVYFPAQGEYDRVVHAVDAESGELVWAAEHPYPIDHQISPTYHLGRVHARRGEALWTLPAEDFTSHFLMVADGVLYGQLDEGYLFAVGSGNGSFLPWEFETGGFSDVLHYAIGDGVVYLAGRDGGVYAHAAPTPGGD